ncbi:MAG: helix-turn-helix transcriptional regulator [Chitinophaga sp.]|uniref:helix-turn-helix transcriptional regulator n=1 Tax=Chitinophaga sp. TaxID=1869181 RepID=UPI001B23799E|nr:AraC family transcriptional regulator [Chitinophaga sp.]MBO9728225.1 helix-turn-helix transcriptional regulator [Chitinophaga sp.]
MGIVITNDANHVLLKESMPFDYRKIRSRAIVEETQEMRHDFGAATLQEYCFDGISMAYCEADVFENIHIHAEFKEPRVVMMFMEQGEVSTSLEGRKDFRFSSLEHNLMFSPSSSESADVKKQRDIQFMGLSFMPHRFLELAEDNGRVLESLANGVAGNRTTTLAEKFNPRITPRMQMVIEEARQCQFQGGLKKLFLQSKTIELLALQCEQVETTFFSSKPVVTKISASDVEKLYYARDLLLQHMQQPLSLEQLSRKAGLNEFKLKSGFKAVFDNTVFGYLSERRLELARELILSSNQPLADIADETGYSSPQHFSNAFRKKFGVSPSKIRE